VVYLFIVEPIIYLKLLWRIMYTRTRMSWIVPVAVPHKNHFFTNGHWHCTVNDMKIAFSAYTTLRLFVALYQGLSRDEN
jgi:hypothetical protein